MARVGRYFAISWPQGEALKGKRQDRGRPWKTTLTEEQITSIRVRADQAHSGRRSRYGGGFLRSAPSLISRRRSFPGARPGSFYPFQQVLPCFLDICRCVYVSVVMDSASRTVPFPN